MKATFVLTSASQKTSAVARGYNAFGSPDDYDAYVTGDGGVYSTVNDLLLLDQALDDERLVKRQTLDEAFAPGRVREGTTTYGFGWNVESRASGKRVWHTGNTAGFRAFIERRLDQRVSVIMLTNRGSSKRVEINQAIQNILAGRPYRLPKKSIAVALHDQVRLRTPSTAWPRRTRSWATLARKYYGIALEKDAKNLHARSMLTRLRSRSVNTRD